MNWTEKWSTFVDTLKESSFREMITDGLWATVKIAVFGLVIGIIIGAIIGMIRVAPKYKFVMRLLDKISAVYVMFFRGTPIVVQLLIAYYVLLPALGIRGVDAVVVGIAVFGLNSGAYVSEIMRGGLNSVDKGQLEAARSLGLSYPVSMIKIVIPQAFKNIIPTLGNEFITLIKETSVLSFISVVDLYAVFTIIGGKNYEFMIPYLVMALIYIVLVFIISIIVKMIEKAFAKSDKKN